MQTSSTINILPPEVFMLIAAGEVVDRPASVVKELVENSIDSGATRIYVDLVSGGLQSIKIIDNGCGIPKDQLSNAILPHATSKVCVASDLESIHSLGFRGEALASIVAVATVTITSKTMDTPLGNFIQCKNGLIVDSGEIGCSDGTTIVVENIFETVPARKKFLKKDRTEQSYITELMEQFIVSNPNISFKYSTDGKELLTHLAGGANPLLDAIYSVWGGAVSSKMVSVYHQDDYIKCFGYIGDVSLSKPTQGYQRLVVNGRIVKDIGISKLIFNCFSQFLMTRQYPVFVLFIEISPSEIDVNTHPSKLEIKFANKDRVNSTISQLCKKVIIQDIDNVVPSHQEYLPSQPFSPPDNTPNNTKVDFLQNSHDIAPNPTNDNPTPNLNIKSLNILYGNQQSSNLLRESTVDIGLAYTYNPNNVAYGSIVDKKQPTVDGTFAARQDSQLTAQNYQDTDAIIIGRIFETYILLQTKNNLYLIDQHAAHEKLLYDKLCATVDSGQMTTQGLLTPYHFQLGIVSATKMIDLLPQLEEIGFEIRPTSERDFAIVALPISCIHLDFSQFITELNLVLDDKKTLSNSKILGDKLKQIACKSAIKAGTSLTDLEIKTLIQQIKQSDIDLFCPHGRPLSVRLTKTQIEKWFKRIL